MEWNCVRIGLLVMREVTRRRLLDDARCGCRVEYAARTSPLVAFSLRGKDAVRFADGGARNKQRSQTKPRARNEGVIGGEGEVVKNRGGMKSELENVEWRRSCNWHRRHRRQYGSWRLCNATTPAPAAEAPSCSEPPLHQLHQTTNSTISLHPPFLLSLLHSSSAVTRPGATLLSRSRLCRRSLQPAPADSLGTTSALKACPLRAKACCQIPGKMAELPMTLVDCTFAHLSASLLAPRR